MAAFAYSAVDSSGRTTKGIIEAASAAAARQALRSRALLPVKVEPTAVRVGGRSRQARRRPR